MGGEFSWDETPDLNITPLVDIMLVLLAILMITAPVMVYEEEISLPTGSKSAKVVEDAKLVIRIDKQRAIYIKENRYTFDNFADNFTLLSNGYDRKAQIQIRADKNLLYGDVMAILKSVKESGFQRIALLSE